MRCKVSARQLVGADATVVQVGEVALHGRGEPVIERGDRAGSSSFTARAFELWAKSVGVVIVGVEAVTACVCQQVQCRVGLRDGRAPSNQSSRSAAAGMPCASIATTAMATIRTTPMTLIVGHGRKSVMIENRKTSRGAPRVETSLLVITCFLMPPVQTHGPLRVRTERDDFARGNSAGEKFNAVMNFAKHHVGCAVECPEQASPAVCVQATCRTPRECRARA
jgi:hypothetical protein